MKAKSLDQQRWKEFTELCAQMDSAKELSELFDLLFTYEEKVVIGARLAIVQALLEEKLTQREIAEQFHVSISQITRGSNALKIASPRLITFLKQ